MAAGSRSLACPCPTSTRPAATYRNVLHGSERYMQHVCGCSRRLARVWVGGTRRDLGKSTDCKRCEKNEKTKGRRGPRLYATVPHLIAKSRSRRSREERDERDLTLSVPAGLPCLPTTCVRPPRCSELVGTERLDPHSFVRGLGDR